MTEPLRSQAPAIEDWPLRDRQDAVDLLRVQTLDLVDSLDVLGRLITPPRYEHPLLLTPELHQLAIATRLLCDAIVRAAEIVDARTATLNRLETQP